MTKIKKLKEKIKQNLKILKRFGFKYAYYDFIESILFRRNNIVGKKYHYKKHQIIKKYLKNKYRDIIEKYKKEKENNNKIKENSPIWVLWYQGEENAPDIIKCCILSIRRNRNKHPVNIITKENYKEYVNMPEYIIEKVENGQISLTHFSDILRVTLLYEYGGIWIDASLYITKKIEDDIKNYKYYTLNHNKFSDWHVCKGKWLDGFLGSGKNNKYMEYMKNMFFEYWKEHDTLICYLLIDCFTALGYENIEFIKKEIDEVPINNTDFFELEKKLSLPYEKEKMNINNTNTYVFKTTYKKQFMKLKNGKSTIYNEILKKKI